MGDVDKWFSTMVLGELERLHEWCKSLQRNHDKLAKRQAVIWFILATCGTIGGIVLGALLS